MTKRRTLQINIVVSLLALLLLFVPMVMFSGNGQTYFSFGPNENFVVLGVVIDTWGRYALLLCLLTIVWIMELMVQEFAHPILAFTVYNPDCKEIPDFGKNELQLYAHAIYTIEGLKWVLQTMINIAQFDIALLGVVIKNLVSIYTIRILLNQKAFLSAKNDNGKDANDPENEEDEPLLTEMLEVIVDP